MEKATARKWDGCVHERGQKVAEAQANEANLYEQIGRLKMELEWLKKVT
ncbi:MAG: hypothetical protein R2932_24180 [Caldilineaceae bacterium]